MEHLSYSKRTKEELSGAEIKKDCCAAAQLAGLALFGGSISENRIKLASENLCVAENFSTLFGRVFSYDAPLLCEKNLFSIEITDKNIVKQVLLKFGLVSSENEKLLRRRISPALVKNNCCKRAFLRGAFLGSAVIVDPRRNYNLEFVTHYHTLVRDFAELLGALSFKAGVSQRAGNCIIYTKNSETICDMLAAIGAPNAQMEILNVKIEKELRNGMNRSANGETANYDKAVSAAVKQLRAIEEIDRRTGVKNLPDDLRALAEMRIRHKDAPLSELGRLLDPPLTKSGVSHRMKKLLNMAENN